MHPAPHFCITKANGNVHLCECSVPSFSGDLIQIYSTIGQKPNYSDGRSRKNWGWPSNHVLSTNQNVSVDWMLLCEKLITESANQPTQARLQDSA